MVLNSEERLPLATKKHVSVKERTRARFDKIIKTALKDPKIKSNKEEILLQSLQRNEVDLESTSAQESISTSFSQVYHENNQEEKGLVNPSFEKDVKEVRNIKSEEKKKNKRKKVKNVSGNFAKTEPQKLEIITKADVHHVPSSSEIEENSNEKQHQIIEKQHQIIENQDHIKEKLTKSSTVRSGARSDFQLITKENEDSDEKVEEDHQKLVSDEENKLLLSGKIKGKDVERKMSHLEGIARTSRRDRIAKSKSATVSENVTKSDVFQQTPSSPTTNNEEILAITIHRVDRLQLTAHINHPLVQIHIIDLHTGNYVKKLHRSRPVTSFYESQNDKVDYILPVMTKPFHFKQQKSVVPRWEETILYNESFHHFVTEKPDVIIFFEVLDFLTASCGEDSTRNQQNGWFRIAWAFLKVVGKNGVINAKRKMQLQLYHPPRHRVQSAPGKANIFLWWSNTTRVRYPGSLHVTVTPILNVETPQPGLRSAMPTQKEQGHISLQDFCNTVTDGETASSRISQSQKHEFSTWDRLPGQNCKIPNKILVNLPGGTKGCLVCAFSPDGKILACGCSDGNTNYISMFLIPSGKWIRCLQKHHGLIYDLNWSHDCKYIVSASGDATCRFWLLDSGNSIVLPHPSFTYAASFHPHIASLIVTGCYDHTVRLWKISAEDRSAQLLQELDRHRGHVNSICFDAQGLKLFSADSTGTICVWNCHVTAHPRHQGITEDWSLYAEISDKELQGTVINHIYFHPNGRNLVIHSQDSRIYLMDTVKQILFQRYTGLLNMRERIRSCVSPCGTYIFSGSEEGNVVVHNVTTGDKVASYSNLPQEGIIHCCVFHPLDHLVAFCGLGDDEPIVIYRYDNQTPQLNIKQVHSRSTFAASKPVNVSPFSSTPIKRGNGDEAHYEPRRSVTFNLEKQEPNSLLEKIKSRLAYVTDTSSQNLSNIKHPTEENLYDTVDTWRTWGSTFDTYESSARTDSQLN